MTDWAVENQIIAVRLAAVVVEIVGNKYICTNVAIFVGHVAKLCQFLMLVITLVT